MDQGKRFAVISVQIVNCGEVDHHYTTIKNPTFLAKNSKLPF